MVITIFFQTRKIYTYIPTPDRSMYLLCGRLSSTHSFLIFVCLSSDHLSVPPHVHLTICSRLTVRPHLLVCPPTSIRSTVSTFIRSSISGYPSVFIRPSVFSFSLPPYPSLSTSTLVCLQSTLIPSVFPSIPFHGPHPYP